MRFLAALCLSLLVLASAAVSRPRRAASHAAAPVDPNSCAPALDAAEREAALPSRLIHTIALVESGRLLPGGVRAWPWTVNVGGAGLYFDSKAEAVREVVMLQSLGVKSIDVGCMQVSLLYHPDAFASLDEAFDPAANARYASRFLKALHGQLGDWPRAAAAYHSQTPDIGADYERRVMALWPLAPSYQVAAATTAMAPDVDPNGIYTPEFAAELAADAALRLERQAAMHGQTLAPPASRLAQQSATRRHKRVTPATSEDEVAMQPVIDHVLSSGRHLVQLGE